MASTNLNDGNSLLIVAHGDDEAIYFLPLLGNTRNIIVAAHPMNESRVAAMNAAYNNTNNPWGKRIKWAKMFAQQTDRQWYSRRIASAKCQDDANFNYNTVINALRPTLTAWKAKGVTRFITHSPWGDYGHPNHRNVSAAVRALGVELGVDVWCPSTVQTNHEFDNGKWLSANFLPGVTYSAAYTYNHAQYKWVRDRFIAIHLNCCGGDDMWTAPHGEYDYPTGPRKFWRIVEGGVDKLSTNPTLLNYVRKIRGDIPWPAGSPYAAYVAPLAYSCP